MVGNVTLNISIMCFLSWIMLQNTVVVECICCCKNSISNHNSKHRLCGKFSGVVTSEIAFVEMYKQAHMFIVHVNSTQFAHKNILKLWSVTLVAVAHVKLTNTKNEVC